MANDRSENNAPQNESRESRRAFLRQWSKAVLAGLLGYGLVEEADQKAEGAGWVNRYGGGGWANNRGAGGWVNNRGGGGAGGGWVNRYGGGGWANNRGAGGWLNAR